MPGPRILFAWELGENLGHASKIAEVARRLEGRARVSVAARDPAAFREIGAGLDIRIGPSPYLPYRPPRPGEPAPIGYVDNLAHMGWDGTDRLARLIADWRALFAREAPDLVVAQAAPTALLAARVEGRKAAILGSGFDTPPAARPMPAFEHWRPDPAGTLLGELERREARIVATANAALARHGAAPLASFAELLRPDRTYLATWAEIDQYAPRDRFEPDHPPYLGQLYTLSSGRCCDWPERPGPRVLAYVRESAAGGPAALDGLAALAANHAMLIASPGISPVRAGQLRDAGALVVDGPVRLDTLLPHARVGVSHASNGIAAAFIAAGVPQLGLPSQMEQVMVARSFTRAGLGLALAGAFAPGHVAQAVSEILADRAMRARVQRTASRLGASARDTAETIASGLLDQALA